MEKNTSKKRCILEKVNKLQFILISEIFALSSNFPIKFIIIVSKWEKIQSLIKKVLSRINTENNFGPKINEYILKYKQSQKLYLTLLEKTISKKIHKLPLELPSLDQGGNEYDKVISENFNQIFGKYSDLKIYCNDMTYSNKKNKWYLQKISEINTEYFNNCVFIVNSIDDIESIISLLYSNKFLDFKTTLTINRIKDDKIRNILLDNQHINYYLEYPRAIIIRKSFVSQLLKLNINFYMCSFENKNRLYDITYQSLDEYRNKNIYVTPLKKKLSLDYNSLQSVNNIISNLKNCDFNNNIFNTDGNSHSSKTNTNTNSNSRMIINKPNISFKEINSYLNEYQSLNLEKLIFENMTITDNSFLGFGSFFWGFKSSNSASNNTINDKKNTTFNNKNNNNLAYSKSLIESNKNSLSINFEKDFFEVIFNNKFYVLNCSEIINYISKSKNIKELYLYNFPLGNMENISNPYVENIYIDNFFNFENGIIFTINNIKKNLPRLSNIKIKNTDFSHSKEFIFLKREDITFKNIKLNLVDDNIEIDNEILSNLNLSLISKRIYSIIKSFKGMNKFSFRFGSIIKHEYDYGKNKKDLIDILYNEDEGFKNIKKIDIDLLKYLNFQNIAIYGGVLNQIKSIHFSINDFENEYDNNKNKKIFGNYLTFSLINKYINSFSESNFSVFFVKDYFLIPFIEDVILKINNNELNKLLNNPSNSLNSVNLYNVNIEVLYNIQNEYLKNLNLFIFGKEKDFSFENKNKNEFNLRFIYNNIPSLESITLETKNHKICFKNSILSLISFNIYFKNDDKKKLVLDFGNNDLLYQIFKKWRYLKKFFRNCKGYIILKINNTEFINVGHGNEVLIKRYNNDDNVLKFITYLYFISLGIIFLINFLNL